MPKTLTPYDDERLQKLEPSAESMDLTRIYDKPVFVTDAVMRTLDAHALDAPEKDRLMWDLVYMSAMNRSPLEDTLCIFRCEIGGEWEAFYAEEVGERIVISEAPWPPKS